MNYVGSNKPQPQFISPVRVLCRLGNTHTIKLPLKMSTHPKFYVDRLSPYYQYGDSLVKTALALKHLSQILLLTMLTLSSRLKFGYLPAKPRDILTSFYHFVVERKVFPLIRKLKKDIIFRVLLPI